ncbi:glycine betaine/L-proline ABC transporter substrate-binding protein ProX [Pseudomonas sp. RC10]|uniref:glycine betaine/L-proline ABC transporter substrate-binding protein ProX n=1 Tax=Pseudomonas bambusae TaxID=3139142 RepID=UPI0031389750
MKQMLKRLLATMTAAVLVSASVLAVAADEPGKGKTVRLAQSDSMGGNYVLTTITAEALKQLGYDVKVSTVNSTLFFQAAAQGDLDIAMDLNFPQRQPGFDKVKDKAQMVGKGSIQGGGYNGYLIDKKTADKYNITSLEQLKDPKIAGLFGKNGKAELINCDPGWSCGDVVEYQLDKFGLKDTITSVRGKYEALMFEVVAREKRGEPVFFYAWIPSWMTNALVPGKDVVWLPTPFDALPPNVPNAGSASIPGVPGCAGNADPCRMAMAVWNWNAVANNTFINANPAVKALAEQISFSRETWSAWEKAISTGGGSDRKIRKMAEDWMNENKTTFDGWVAAAKNAG